MLWARKRLAPAAPDAARRFCRADAPHARVGRPELRDPCLVVREIGQLVHHELRPEADHGVAEGFLVEDVAQHGRRAELAQSLALPG